MARPEERSRHHLHRIAGIKDGSKKGSECGGDQEQDAEQCGGIGQKNLELTPQTAPGNTGYGGGAHVGRMDMRPARLGGFWGSGREASLSCSARSIALPA